MAKWISVRDELPKSSGRYLCYFHFEDNRSDIVCENTYLGGGLWVSEFESVTHWMPLPGIPVEFKEVADVGDDFRCYFGRKEWVVGR